MNESIERIDNIVAMYTAELINLAEIFERKTEGKITVCTNSYPDRIQLYSRTTPDETLSILKELADDCEVTLRTSSQDFDHYDLKIDRHQFCIVLSKEDNKDE